REDESASPYGGYAVSAVVLSRGDRPRNGLLELAGREDQGIWRHSTRAWGETLGVHPSCLLRDVVREGPQGLRAAPPVRQSGLLQSRALAARDAEGPLGRPVAA